MHLQNLGMELSWTEVADLNTARQALASAGIQTAALAAGGTSPFVPGRVANTELWNGTSWTEVNDLNQKKILFCWFRFINRCISYGWK
jgi:hypothetical protein